MREENLTSKKDIDIYFMTLAELTAKRSKDSYTKVGACIVKENRVLSLGYNGAPRGFNDDLVPSGRDSSLPLMQQKNAFMCHAELNAILNYRGSLADIEGASIYITFSPCNECAKALAQLKIKEVIYKEEYHRKEIVDVSKYILKTCGIKYRALKS